MCGIAGVLRLKPEEPDGANRREIARSMASHLVHRGPDDAGDWESADGSIGLAHRRLAIIDLSPLGRNPMDWDGGRLHVTFNGEIYNFHELRVELEALGHRFKSQTDTEVILAAYDQWGVESVQKFVGMFAFALWDEPRRRLWIVRDRLGKKPLYYSERAGELRFASELKCLVAAQGFPRTIDRAALRLYLRYGYVPAPYSIYEAARKLPPAHQLICEHGRCAVSRYWNPLAFVEPRPASSDAEAVAELESRLSLAVRQRLQADVPLGAFLSGGVDSSLVAALMQEHTASPVRTFTIRFENPEFNEADHAAAVARHLGTEHSEETCSTRQLLDVVDGLPDMFDEPFADSSAVPTFLVSRIARQHVTVALSGDGGDELFYGYPRYHYHASGGWALDLPAPVRFAAAAVASRMPVRRLRRIADVLKSEPGDSYSHFVSWWSDPEVRVIAGAFAGVPPAIRELGRRPTTDWRSIPPLQDLVTYLPDDILTKVDRASMAVGLEVRAPLLDHRVVEFALGLPLHLRYRNGTTKWILRQMLHKRVPQRLIERPKMGFGVPLADWFRGPFRDRMEDYVTGPDLEELGLHPEPARDLWRNFVAGRADRTDRLWLVFMLVAWWRRCGRPAPRQTET